MTDYTFETDQPIQLLAEIDKGSVTVTAADTSQTLVEIEGRDADQVRVEQHDRQVRVIGPRQRSGFFGGDASLHVSVRLPEQSEMDVRTGQADITVLGPVGAASLRSGSGDVRAEMLNGPTKVETGSGDVEVTASHAELAIKSGSGDVQVDHALAPVAVSTGSGDVRLGTTHEKTAVKTGSGSLVVVAAHHDLSLATGSGDFAVAAAHRGRMTLKGASGDVHIGVPRGLPVWTDIYTLSGSVTSALESAGQPEEGADHLEVRAKSVSGDIELHHV
jgi:DUF4097 and DUF4098 domain-containing protein YvlB